MRKAVFVAVLSVSLFGSTIVGWLLADYLNYRHGIVLSTVQLAVVSILLSLWFAWGVSRGPKKKEVLAFGERW